MTTNRFVVQSGYEDLNGGLLDVLEEIWDGKTL